MSVRVLLAEDQAMVRGAIAALLALEEDIEIVAQASRGDEVVALALESGTWRCSTWRCPAATVSARPRPYAKICRLAE
jgi:hypothetical protein